MEKLSDIKGKSVISADGKTVGKLADLALDERAWSVAAIVVEVDPAVASLFGVKRKLLRAPRVNIAADRVEVVSDVIKLRENLADLKVELHEV
jgi:sporulation protein YlmC with PRC-barrel domain